MVSASAHLLPPVFPKQALTPTSETLCLVGSLGQSVQFNCSVVSNSLQPHGLQQARPPCPSATPIVYSNSCPLSRWCHPTISSSVVPFSSCLQSFPASGSFPVSQVFTTGGQSIGAAASASVLPVYIQDRFFVFFKRQDYLINLFWLVQRVRQLRDLDQHDSSSGWKAKIIPVSEL